MRTAFPLLPLAAAAGVLIGLAGLSAAPAAPDEADRDEARRLGVISQRNIFLRDRRRYVPPALVAPPSTQPTSRPAAAAPAPPRPAYRLMGVASRDDQFVAYFEDAAADRLLEIQAGQELAGGIVTAVTIAGVTHREGEKITRMRVGEGLGTAPGVAWRPPPRAPSTGGSTSTTQASPPGSPPSAARPPSSTPPASGDVADILERLRRRREQELNK
jgi:hypothetical protein